MPINTGVSEGKVIRAAAEEHQSMYTETRHVPYTIKKESLTGYTFDVDFQGVEFHDLEISMTGEHQIKNAVAALAALCILEERGNIDLPRTSPPPADAACSPGRPGYGARW